MYRFIIFLLLLLCACTHAWRTPSDFVYAPIDASKYTIATFQRISDNVSPIHIYVEGDGNSFDAYGQPTLDPTPRGTFLRDLAASDNSPNVIYMARPCQFIKSVACSRTDWTTGRFSSDIIESVAVAIKQVAGNTPIVLIGYSGGGLVTGLVIQKHPEISVQRWITIAGVLNHADWTEYFGDAPLVGSLNLNELPRIEQCHYIAHGDHVVPNVLSRKWVADNNLIVIDDATHNSFPQLKIF